jgi:hypothetical protein
MTLGSTKQGDLEKECFPKNSGRVDRLESKRRRLDNVEELFKETCYEK